MSTSPPFTLAERSVEEPLLQPSLTAVSDDALSIISELDLGNGNISFTETAFTKPAGEGRTASFKFIVRSPKCPILLRPISDEYVALLSQALLKRKIGILKISAAGKN